MRKFIKKILKESDDFDWIRDVQPYSYEYLNGKGLEFIPNIDNDDDLMRILNFLSSLGFEYGTWPSGMVWGDETILGLLLERGRVLWTNGNIPETYQEHINGYQEHIYGYNGRGVEVLNGWDIIKSII